MRFPRRSFLAMCAGSFASLASSNPTPVWKRYRIDATITAFGATIFSRKHVGEALARLDVAEKNGDRQMNFTFMGSSLPERTRGILQLGHFEEQLEESRGRLAKSRYFGFLTSAPPEGEKRLDKVVEKQRGASCCAVEGRLAADNFRFRKTYDVYLPENSNFAELPQLRKTMHAAMENACSQSCLNGDSTPAAQRTFLKTLVDAVECRDGKLEVDYHYGDQLLRFRGKKCGASEGLASLEAQVQGRGRHRFALHYRPENPVALPEKVEYWPRTWLRLTMVALEPEVVKNLSKNSQSKEST